MEAPPRMHQNSPFSEKNQKILGWGTSPSPDQWGGGHPLPTPQPPRRLVRPPNFKTVVVPLVTHAAYGQRKEAY